MREELDRLKARIGNQELGQISKQLDSAEQTAKENDKMREIQRKNLAMLKRLEEVEELLQMRDSERSEYLSQIKILEDENIRLTNLLESTNEKCK